MPFPRPTLTQLRNQVAADISAGVDGADGLLRYSNLAITGVAQAGLANGHYGYLDYIARQGVPFTATDEYLEGWAAFRGVTRKPATQASGTASFVSAEDGIVVPAGSLVSRSDNVAYRTTTNAVSVGGHVRPTIRAVSAGVEGNAAVGIGLTLGIAIAGITGTGGAYTVLAGGAEIETDDEFRARMLQAYANPPQGGSRGDYVEWSLDVPGVTRCWVVPAGMGPGTVVLYFMLDDAQIDHGGFPQGTNGVAAEEGRDAAATGDQLILANAIFDLQPVTALVYAVAPVANQIGLTIAGIGTPPSAVRNAIAASVRRALLLSAKPGGVTNISAIEAAIAAVNGAAGFVLTAVTASAGTIVPGAAGNIISDAGALPTLQTITYTA